MFGNRPYDELADINTNVFGLRPTVLLQYMPKLAVDGPQMAMWSSERKEEENGTLIVKRYSSTPPKYCMLPGELGDCLYKMYPLEKALVFSQNLGKGSRKMDHETGAKVVSGCIDIPSPSTSATQEALHTLIKTCLHICV